jgi:hypothetical protein
LAWAQTEQDVTNALTADFIPRHAKSFLSLLKVIGKPECPPRGLLWKAFMIRLYSSSLFLSQLQLFSRMTPSNNE